MGAGEIRDRKNMAAVSWVRIARGPLPLWTRGRFLPMISNAEVVSAQTWAKADMASHTVDWRTPFPPEARKGAVTVGNFDGVHRGHATLIEHLRSQSARIGGPAVVLTFDPHPRAILRPNQPISLLTTPADRASLLLASGADHVLTVQTSRELLGLSAREFFQHVLRDQLQAVSIVEGPNFEFGRKREGDIHLLARLCQEAGIGLSVVHKLNLDGEQVSSSRVRSALLAGDVRLAEALLGRPYRLHGTVGTGQQRGRTIGFPTANLQDMPTVVPGDGVYAVRVNLPGERQPRAGALNIGANPTFGEGARKVEVHILDWPAPGQQADLYGQEVGVDFLERLRGVQTFPGPAQLIEQLRQDSAAARAACARRDT